MKYTVDYFIKKFKAIPENQWYQGLYHNRERTKFCALGHCGKPYSSKNREFIALDKLFRVLGSGWGKCMVGDINDGMELRYRQKSPKQRILAALKDIKRGTINGNT